jgi:hypothetical protein
MPEDHSSSDAWSLSDNAEEQLALFDRVEEPPET